MHDYDAILNYELKYVYCPAFVRFYSILDMLVCSEIWNKFKYISIINYIYIYKYFSYKMFSNKNLIKINIYFLFVII